MGGDPSLMRVLVIGANGFIGRHLVEALRLRGHEVWAPSRREFPMNVGSAFGLSGFEGGALPDAVINLAAVATVDDVDVPLLFDVNAFAVGELLDALVDRGFQGRYVQSSSAYVYEPTEVILTEESCRTPTTPYGHAKLFAEFVCERAAGSLDVTVLRFFNVSGVGHHPQFLVPKLVRSFRERHESIHLGHLDTTRDILDVRDCTELISRLLHVEPEGSAPGAPGYRVFNICSGTAHTIRSIVEILARRTGHSPELVIAREGRHSVPSVQRGTSARIMGLLGFSPAYAIEDTLAWMLESQPNGVA